MEPKKTSRRRCFECRGWYRPEPSASLTQKTCGSKCRLRRRGKYEKKRRASDLGAAREGDRDRQRHHRERARASAGESPPMSRTGLSAQATDAIEEIVEKLGHAQRLSQAGLRRQLRRFSLGKPGPASRKTGT
jgi:hypothetical protein